MFERFSNSARRVVVLAQEEARVRGHAVILPDHLMLALTNLPDSTAAGVLATLNVSLDELRDRVDQGVGAGGAEHEGHLPFGPAAKRTLAHALKESLQLQHSHVGTEHLLIGVVREGDGSGATALEDLGVELLELRQAVVAASPPTRNEEREATPSAVPEESAGGAPSADSAEGEADGSDAVTDGPGVAPLASVYRPSPSQRAALTAVPSVSTGVPQVPDVPAPRVLYEKLAATVVGQDQALRLISVAVFRHYAFARLRRSGAIRDKDNVLLIGPSGSGKTMIARTLAEILDVPLVMTDATAMTAAGYVGESVESIIPRLIDAAGSKKWRAPFGIVFIDEIDKAARIAGHERDIGGEGVQQALLTMLSGATVRYVSNDRQSIDRSETLDTTNVLFILGGAFTGLEPTVVAGHGYLEDTADVLTVPAATTQQDLERFGFLAEFAGRLTTIVELRSLEAPDYERLLRLPTSVVGDYTALFADAGVTLEVTDDAVAALARQAAKDGAGARSVRRLAERPLYDLLFALPGVPDIDRCIVTAKTVRREEAPKIITKSGQNLTLAEVLGSQAEAEFDASTRNPGKVRLLVEWTRQREISAIPGLADDVAYANAVLRQRGLPPLERTADRSFLLEIDPELDSGVAVPELLAGYGFTVDPGDEP